jgi:hypothetical protein
MIPRLADSTIASAEDLIQLPRFDAGGAVAVGDQLLAAAASRELPRSIVRARDTLADELGALRIAAAARSKAMGGADPSVLAGADAVLDSCWNALFDWLTGFSKLPEAMPQAQEARALLAELYPDGLSFILLPYELEWNQSELRLDLIAEIETGDRLRALGGQPFIDALVDSHRLYGSLLGLSSHANPAEPPVVVSSLRPALERFASALRNYALKVTALVEIDEPATAALAKALLEPLLSWKSSTLGLRAGETTLY